MSYLAFRDDDFPFQKIAFSVWENSEFRFKGLSKWKFRLAIDTVPQKFRLQKTYELRIRVLSKSHMISKPLRHRLYARFACAARLNDSCALQNKLASYRMYCAGNIARCDDCTALRIGQSTSQ